MNTPMPPPPPPKPGPPARPTPPARAEVTFNSALERPPAEREAFVAQACGEDTVLTAEVRGLLQAHDAAGDFVKTGAPHSPEVERELARLKPEESGDRIGPYKLLQQIGEGGFGTVWMAEQEQPVRRRVALKIIKLGMDTKEVIARFEQERQALAMMDHPNIAKVFDAGATQWGRPFFVMELVRGVKITEYCDDNEMPTADRLRLFILVCQAVQHAHQKGIVHRDIKPSNVLVTVNDGAPVPKVIDFGVAKAMQGRLTDRTLFTQFEQMVGTPLYMSPEQAEMTSLDVDTRSDIYSLGVLLYELLTGRTPIEAATMQQAGLDEIRRIIREVDPPRPSLRMATLDGSALTDAGKRRHTDPAKLPGTLRGDLDWVVMKCLEKARDRRYETANALALDIQRHLANEPIAARPPGSLYLLQKLIRRNKLAFAATASVAIALIAGIGMTTWQARRAERGEAKANRALADLKKSAPALFQLAHHEADAQRFESSLEKLDSALLLDPSLPGALWERSWLLVGLERWEEAAATARRALNVEPASEQIEARLPVLAEFATSRKDEQWNREQTARLLDLLREAKATATMVKLSSRLMADAKPRAELVRAKLKSWLGAANSTHTVVTAEGLVAVMTFPRNLATVEPLHGLPIDQLYLSDTKVTNLEPLKGMRLKGLTLIRCAVPNLTPLIGMPLEELSLDGTPVKSLEPLAGLPLRICHLGTAPVTSLEPLRGAPLEVLSGYGFQFRNFSPLKGAPLRRLIVLREAGGTSLPLQNLDFLEGAPIEELTLGMCVALTDISALKGAPIRRLMLRSSSIRDLTPLQGAPLELLELKYNNVIADLSPLTGAPIETLDIASCPKLKDLTPLNGMGKLERLSISYKPGLLDSLRDHPSLVEIACPLKPGDQEVYRPVGEFWAAYDAKLEAEKIGK